MCPGDETPDRLESRRALRFPHPTGTLKGCQGNGGRTHLVSPAMAAAGGDLRPFRRCFVTMLNQEGPAHEAF